MAPDGLLLTKAVILEGGSVTTITSQTGSIVVIVLRLLLWLQSAAAFAPMQKYQANAQHTIANNTSGSNGDLSNLSNNNGHSELPQVTASGNNVYVVWLDDTPGSRDVFLRRSTDGGNTFDTKIINLSKNNLQGGGLGVQSKNYCTGK